MYHSLSMVFRECYKVGIVDDPDVFCLDFLRENTVGFVISYC